MSRRPELVVASGCDLGEAPVYDRLTGMLYWADITAGRLWRLNTESGMVAHRHVGAPLGSVALVDGGGLLVAVGDRVMLLRSWSSEPDPLARVSAGDGRINDGCCDPFGRFVAGTVGAGGAAGEVFVVDADGSSRPLFGDVLMSNGLDWSPDGRFFYHVDSGRGTITRHRWDGSDAPASAPEIIVSIPTAEGLPDGMTVASDGTLWVALWGPGEVRRYSGEGALLETVSFPVPNTTSCVFGGRDLTTLFVTTAKQDSAGGDLYLVRLDEVGLPSRPFVDARSPGGVHDVSVERYSST